MFTQNVETKEPFSSRMVLVKMVMVQALWTEDDSFPWGLTLQNMYTELRQGSKKAVVVVRNSMVYLQILQKKTPVARAVAALPVSEPHEEDQLQEVWMSIRVPILPDWLLGKDMVNYLMNWIWVVCILGPLSWWMLPTGSWLNTMMCSCWIQWSWAVPTPQNTR